MAQLLLARQAIFTISITHSHLICVVMCLQSQQRLSELSFLIVSIQTIRWSTTTRYEFISTPYQVMFYIERANTKFLLVLTEWYLLQPLSQTFSRRTSAN